MARAIFFHSARLNNAIKKMTKLPPFRLHASEPCPIRKHVPKSPPPPSFRLHLVWSLSTFPPMNTKLCKSMQSYASPEEEAWNNAYANHCPGRLAFPRRCAFLSNCVLFLSSPPVRWRTVRGILGKIWQQECNFWILKFAYLEQIKKLFKIFLNH